MKVALASDVHLEFGPLQLKNEEGADVLILSGDICTAKDFDTVAAAYGDMPHSNKAARYVDFFRNCSREFKHVVYVIGNHEHYNYDFKHTANDLKRYINDLKLDNVYLLDNEYKEIEGVGFIGGTMWTNMNNRDPLTLFHIKSMMNDFRCVKNSNKSVYRTVPLYKRKEDDSGYELDEKGYMIQVGTKKKEEPSTFSPEDAADEFDKFMQYLQVCTEFLGEDPKKYVVCTHHTPSHQSCHPYYKHDTLMNGGYHSDLEEFILNRPNIKLWTHGHTHEDFDYLVGECRVVCNPRGYIGHEGRADKWKLKYMEV
jgi:Icc-related predicted phosphoesterase